MKQVIFMGKVSRAGLVFRVRRGALILAVKRGMFSVVRGHTDRPELITDGIGGRYSVTWSGTVATVREVKA